MFLVKHSHKFYKIVKSVRVNGKSKKITLKYIGKLTPQEFNRLKILLQNAKEPDIDNLILKAKNPQYILNSNDSLAPKKTLRSLPSESVPNLPINNSLGPNLHKQHHKLVQLIEVRPNVFKKVINKAWLKEAYTINQMSIGSMAQVLGVGKDRIREALEELSFLPKTRSKIAKERRKSSHIEFGWTLVNGQRVKDPIEFKIIEEMMSWKFNEGLSYEKIAFRLTELGIRGRLGAQNWDRGSVRRMILRNTDHIN